MLRLALDGFTSFSTAPLRMATLMASLGVFAAIGLAAYVIAGFFLGKTIPGWASLALIVVFFSTAQLACLAIFGEYLGRAYMQGKQRPLYMIDEIVIHPADDDQLQGR
jgi:dolichol-phosphate mannosyltransferase